MLLCYMIKLYDNIHSCVFLIIIILPARTPVVFHTWNVGVEFHNNHLPVGDFVCLVWNLGQHVLNVIFVMRRHPLYFQLSGSSNNFSNRIYYIDFSFDIQGVHIYRRGWFQCSYNHKQTLYIFVTMETKKQPFWNQNIYTI